MALLKYFQKKESSPEGRFSQDPPKLCTSSASPVLDRSKKRGSYLKFSSEEKAEIGKYASEHGVMKAKKHFEAKNVKESSIRDWRKAYEKELKEKFSRSKPGDIVSVNSLTCKKRGRPPLLGLKLDEQLQSKVLSMRTHQAVINSNVVLGLARALLLKNDKGLLHDFDGPIALNKEWARHFLRRMGFTKRRATSTSKVIPKDFVELQKNFLVDIYSIAKMEDIPDPLIVNWDQTAMKIVPTSSWTMEKKGTKRVEIAATDDKRQITGVFACSLAGDFLPLQLVYEGTTPRCLPKVNFPKDWHLTFSKNHWSTEATMIDYINCIIIPYVIKKRSELGLTATHPALVIFDYFKGQCQPAVLKLLGDNNIFYILVPANCTDRLQPLDLSCNKPAKDYLKQKFQEWYAEIILKQMEDGIEETVDMRLTIMKPLVAKWVIEMHKCFSSRPQMLINGFRAAGILDALKCK